MKLWVLKFCTMYLKVKIYVNYINYPLYAARFLLKYILINIIKSNLFCNQLFYIISLILILIISKIFKILTNIIHFYIFIFLCHSLLHIIKMNKLILTFKKFCYSLVKFFYTYSVFLLVIMFVFVYSCYI